MKNVNSGNEQDVAKIISTKRRFSLQDNIWEIIFCAGLLGMFFGLLFGKRLGLAFCVTGGILLLTFYFGSGIILLNRVKRGGEK